MSLPDVAVLERQAREDIIRADELELMQVNHLQHSELEHVAQQLLRVGHVLLERHDLHIASEWDTTSSLQCVSASMPIAKASPHSISSLSRILSSA